MDTEPLAVVDGIVDGMDLKFAPVARTRVDLPDREASLEALLNDLLQTERRSSRSPGR